MQGEELKEFIENVPCLKPGFKGVFSINTMPKKIKKRQFYFANIDLQHGRGSHWICVLKNDQNELEIFDSLGLNETKLEWFLKYNKCTNITSIEYNTTEVQSPFSNTCGKFVLYFIIKRLLNIDQSFTHILNDIFEENVENNEIIVRNFLNFFIND